jgi:OTU domain-containing protein 5
LVIRLIYFGMTRILIQRGSSSAASSSSSNPSRATAASARAEPPVNHSEGVSVVKDEEIGEELQEHVVVDEFVEISNGKVGKSDDLSSNIEQNENLTDEIVDGEKVRSGGGDDVGDQGELMTNLSGLRISERGETEIEDVSGDSLQNVIGMTSQPPPPPGTTPKKKNLKKKKKNIKKKI